MDTQPDEVERVTRREDAWAPPVKHMSVTDAPAEAMNLNVDGRQPASPLQGFGRMWQKTFQINLTGVELSVEETMRIWRENFSKFQPPENRFYPAMTGVKPGSVLLIDAKVPPFPGMPSIMPVSTGVMVLYADEESFTVMCPEGHPLSGWNTFRVFNDDGNLVAEVQEQSRASDPLYEFFFRFLGSSNQQDKIWVHVLKSLAGNFGVDGQVRSTKTLIDPGVQWSHAGNIKKNAAIRTMFYVIGTPFRWLANKLKRNN
jgi:hypothetical protein